MYIKTSVAVPGSLQVFFLSAAEAPEHIFVRYQLQLLLDRRVIRCKQPGTRSRQPFALWLSGQIHNLLGSSDGTTSTPA